MEGMPKIDKERWGTSPSKRARRYRIGSHHEKLNALTPPIFGSGPPPPPPQESVAARSVIGRCQPSLFVVFCLFPPMPRGGEGKATKNAATHRPIAWCGVIVLARTMRNLMRTRPHLRIWFTGRYSAALGYRALFPIVVCFLSFLTPQMGGGEHRRRMVGNIAL